MRLMLRFFGLLFAAGTIMFIVGVAAAAGLLWHFSKALPDYSQLQDYEPAVMTRVHASDGSLLAEYARERRLYIPIQAMPKLVINAFIAAEDKNFYEHGGIDFSGIARAALLYVQQYGSGRRPQGASTITQQVAKNFLLTNEVSLRAQDQGSAARDEDRAHLLQGEDPRALSQRNLSRHGRLRRRRRVAALFRQVGARADARGSRLSRGAAEGARTTIIRSASASARSSAATTCSTAWSRTATSPRRRRRRRRRSRSRSRRGRPAPTSSRPNISPRRCAATSTRTTARRSSTKAACRCAPRSIPSCRCWRASRWSTASCNFDEQQGYRGAVQQARHGRRLGRQARRGQGAVRRRAVAARGGAGSRTTHPPASACSPAREPGGARRPRSARPARVPLEGVKWAKPHSGPSKGKAPTKVSQVLDVGDVIYVEPLAGKDGQFRLRQVPEVSGAHRGDGSADRPRAGDGRRLLLRPEPVQPRDPGAAPARLLVQAARLCGRARQRLYALDRRDGRADRDRYRQRHLGAGKLFAASSTGPRRCASASSSRAT